MKGHLKSKTRFQKISWRRLNKDSDNKTRTCHICISKKLLKLDCWRLKKEYVQRRRKYENYNCNRKIYYNQNFNAHFRKKHSGFDEFKDSKIENNINTITSNDSAKRKYIQVKLKSKIEKCALVIKNC